MRNRIFNLFSVGLLSLALYSCSDSFLEEKKNYDNLNETDTYNNVSGCNARLNDLYSWCLPQINGLSWKFSSDGSADEAGKSTEEYSGFSSFVDPQTEMTTTGSENSVPDYFMGNQTNIQEAVYGRIRNINDFIKGVNGGSISQEYKDKFLGQAYFFRAWCYYNLVKWYGGVPIVTEPSNPNDAVFTQRSTTKACVDFIVEDLNQAADLLKAYTENGGWDTSDWGRITSGTALALKGRVLLLWASPLFNRANDQERWSTAYETMKADLTRIDACGYGLYGENSTSNVNGSAFASIFTQSTKNPEAVFVTLYNNFTDYESDQTKNNSWERAIRPSNTGGSGKQASEMLVGLFPMSDGKIPQGAGTYTKLTSSEISYDEMCPFVDRDPRFYRTFAFPGFRWAYNGDASQKESNNPSDGANYVLWNYVWYEKLSDAGDAESGNSYAADNLGSSKAGVYVRKKSDDLDVNSSPLYNYVASGTKGAGPFYSAAPLIEMRYAEVLLNMAEVACGAGHLDEAVSYLKRIRARAGYTSENNYGLQDNLLSDQATCMSAVLYERQIELAYEGKRFDDLRRWMLYDGGATKVANAPSTWTLTGWGGNTCTWLGFTPLNGQRRENIQYRVADKYGVGKPEYGADPLLRGLYKDYLVAQKPDTVISDVTKLNFDDIKPMANSLRPAGVNLMNGDLVAQIANLQSWYKDNLVYKVSKGDARDSQKIDLYINFRPNYYLLGFTMGAMTQNVGLQQTIGWGDYNNGGADGTFDPLAE